MTQKSLRAIAALIFLAVYSAADSPARAIELISNGDFETGDYAGWTKNVQLGSDGNFFNVPYTGGTTPSSACHINQILRAAMGFRSQTRKALARTL